MARRLIELLSTIWMSVALVAALAGSALATEEDASQNYYNVSASPLQNALQAAKNNPDQKGFMDQSFPGGTVRHGQNGTVDGKQESYTTTGANWPAVVPPCTNQIDPRSAAAIKAVNQATSANNPLVGRNLVSGNVAATAMAVGMQQAIARAQMPESIMPLAKEMQNQQNQQNADNCANMERNQAATAIDYVRTYLENFTTNPGNNWNKLRNELFIPMALLLLLPGAVLAQAKAVVAQGFSIFGDVSPFEGITRSLVAIFLIPGTYLVVNYGIDLSNSINYTISSEYQRIFGSDMYRDAMAAHIRAFPVRMPEENKNYVPDRNANMQQPLGSSTTAFAKMEGRSLSIKLEDPVAGLHVVPEDRANEMVPYYVNSQRMTYNAANAGLATTWTILCAFQIAYLYYLWFVGPVVAALWVWPMKQLRGALPNWVDGVVTLCFWSLFWNTTILIMACFRGVDDTGTVIMTALNFLSTACVKFAFDFSGLVKAAGAEAAKMAEKGAQGGQKGGSKGGSQGGSASGSKSATGAANHGPNNSHSSTSTPSHSTVSPNSGATPGSGPHAPVGTGEGKNSTSVNSGHNSADGFNQVHPQVAPPPAAGEHQAASGAHEPATGAVTEGGYCSPAATESGNPESLADLFQGEHPERSIEPASLFDSATFSPIDDKQFNTAGFDVPSADLFTLANMPISSDLSLPGWQPAGPVNDLQQGFDAPVSPDMQQAAQQAHEDLKREQDLAALLSQQDLLRQNFNTLTPDQLQQLSMINPEAVQEASLLALQDQSASLFDGLQLTDTQVPDPQQVVDLPPTDASMDIAATLVDATLPPLQNTDDSTGFANFGNNAQEVPYTHNLFALGDYESANYPIIDQSAIVAIPQDTQQTQTWQQAQDAWYAQQAQETYYARPTSTPDSVIVMNDQQQIIATPPAQEPQYTTTQHGQYEPTTTTQYTEYEPSGSTQYIQYDQTGSTQYAEYDHGGSTEYIQQEPCQAVNIGSSHTSGGTTYVVEDDMRYVPDHNYSAPAPEQRQTSTNWVGSPAHHEQVHTFMTSMATAANPQQPTRKSNPLSRALGRANSKNPNSTKKSHLTLV